MTPHFGLWAFIAACTSPRLLARPPRDAPRRRARSDSAAAAAAAAAARTAANAAPPPAAGGADGGAAGPRLQAACDISYGKLPAPRGRRRAVGRHAFSSLFGRPRGRPLPGGLQLGIALLLVLSGVTIAFAAVVETFALDIHGAVGKLLPPASQNQTFSIITLGDAIVTANPYANKAALGGLQAVFFTLTLALPLGWAALLLLLWLAPLRPQQTRRLYRWCEVAQAWACLDVFILTTIVSLIELDQFSKFILGDECDGINKVLDEYFSDLVDGDTVCFGTRSTPLRGCWILFTASLFQHAAGWFVIHAATVALDDEAPPAADGHGSTLDAPLLDP